MWPHLLLQNLLNPLFPSVFSSLHLTLSSEINPNPRFWQCPAHVSILCIAGRGILAAFFSLF